MTTNQEERVRHVLGWRQSGLTAVEYSEKAGVPTSSLRYWAYEHDRANRRKPVRLARVERTEKAPSLVIEMGDVRIVSAAQITSDPRTRLRARYRQRPHFRIELALDELGSRRSPVLRRQLQVAVFWPVREHAEDVS